MVDQDAVEILRKSKKAVGHLMPCVKDQDGNILSGRHRKQVDPNWPETVKHVKDPLDRELLILHYNVQRKVSEAETAQRLLKIAQILEERGIETKKVAKKIVKLVPFEKSWVYSLLPRKYKEFYQVRVKSSVVEFPHENVKEISRIEASKKLAKILNEVPPGEDPYKKVVEEMMHPYLPFPDCACTNCSHLEKCRFIK